MLCKLFLSNLGKVVERVDISFVKLPTVCVTPAVSVVGYVNVLSSTIVLTRNDPL